MSTNTVSTWQDAHSQTALRKAREVDLIASSLLSNEHVTLGTDLSGYGEGGWHRASGNLDEGDARVLALAIWYDLNRLPTPDRHILWQEAAALPRPGAEAWTPLQDLASSLRGYGWCAETSASPEEYPGHVGAAVASPHGQCAVTALLVQQVAGGTIVRVEVTDAVRHGLRMQDVTCSHYYNVLDDGSEVDLTRGQFTSYNRVTDPQERSRCYLLSNASTRKRYARLAERVQLPFVESVPS